MSNTYEITWNEKRVLRKIAHRIVQQSSQHQNNIKIFYKILAEEARDMFTEDNNTTLDDLLLELHREASKEVLPFSTLDESVGDLNDKVKKLELINQELRDKIEVLDPTPYCNWYFVPGSPSKNSYWQGDCGKKSALVLNGTLDECNLIECPYCNKQMRTKNEDEN